MTVATIPGVTVKAFISLEEGVKMKTPSVIRLPLARTESHMTNPVCNTPLYSDNLVLTVLVTTNNRVSNRQYEPDHRCRAPRNCLTEL